MEQQRAPVQQSAECVQQPAECVQQLAECVQQLVECVQQLGALHRPQHRVQPVQLQPPLRFPCEGIKHIEKVIQFIMNKTTS